MARAVDGRLLLCLFVSASCSRTQLIPFLIEKKVTNCDFLKNHLNH